MASLSAISNPGPTPSLTITGLIGGTVRWATTPTHHLAAVLPVTAANVFVDHTSYYTTSQESGSERESVDGDGGVGGSSIKAPESPRVRRGPGREGLSRCSMCRKC
jgi:hypothetical protein